MTERFPDVDKLSAAEAADIAARCLEKLEPGFQPLPLFTQLSRLVVTSTVEMVAINERNNTPHVVLSQRPENCPWWPGQWHLPGTVLLPTDEEVTPHDYETPVKRLYKSEFDGTVALDGAVHIFDAQRRSGPRGSEQTVFGWSSIKILDEKNGISGGQLFDAKNVESELAGEQVIEGHLDTVKRAMGHYARKI